MKYSQIFSKTKRQAPKDEITKNAQLLIRAGFVNKLMAGVYTYLPLGLRVIRKIENIIREEMNAIGGQEIFMPALHPSENWKTTGAWDSVDVLFKIKSRTEKDYALGQSHEEVVTPLAKEYLNSYKDLPISLYQIQQKYRDELRAKSGILRGREFNMKDMYSWHRDSADFERYYDIVKKAYLKIYEKCGLVAKVTEASGGAFTKKISYEFMVLTDAGEDDILYCPDCDYCINTAIAQTKEGDKCPKCDGLLQKGRASEVGNVFDLGDKFCRDFKLSLMDEKGEKFYPVMGCYGIGISRLMGVIVEKFNDDKGIIWPENVAPFQFHLVNLENETVAQNLYEKIKQSGKEILWDDRKEVGAGQKFADADLIGCPVRLVVSQRNGDKIEWKKRNEKESELLSVEEILEKVK